MLRRNKRYMDTVKQVFKPETSKNLTKNLACIMVVCK